MGNQPSVTALALPANASDVVRQEYNDALCKTEQVFDMTNFKPFRRPVPLEFAFHHELAYFRDRARLPSHDKWDPESFHSAAPFLMSTLNAYVNLLRMYHQVVSSGKSNEHLDEARDFLLPRQALFQHYTFTAYLLAFLNNCFTRLVTNKFAASEPGLLLASVLEFVDTSDDVRLAPVEQQLLMVMHYHITKWKRMTLLEGFAAMSPVFFNKLRESCEAAEAQDTVVSTQVRAVVDAGFRDKYAQWLRRQQRVTRSVAPLSAEWPRAVTFVVLTHGEIVSYGPQPVTVRVPSGMCVARVAFALPGFLYENTVAQEKMYLRRVQELFASGASPLEMYEGIRGLTRSLTQSELSLEPSRKRRRRDASVLYSVPHLRSFRNLNMQDQYAAVYLPGEELMEKHFSKERDRRTYKGKSTILALVTPGSVETVDVLPDRAECLQSDLMRMAQSKGAREVTIVDLSCSPLGGEFEHGGAAYYRECMETKEERVRQSRKLALQLQLG